MDEQPFSQFLQQINEKFIMPEIEKRKGNSSLPLEFKIYECLIKFPKNLPAIVQFNSEIGWFAKAKRGDGLSFTPDKHVYLHEIIEIESVEAPEVNGERVAFHYLFWNGLTYQVLCDFTPNWPDELLKPEDKKWSLGGIITSHLQAKLTEEAIKLHDIAQKDLQKIGLWAVPALLPYPLAKILKELQEGKIEDAHQTLLRHCTAEFVAELTKKWWSLEVFNLRRKLIEEASIAHQLKYYHLSIHSLLPHIEGVMTDWEYIVEEEEKIPWKEGSKAKKFKDLTIGTEPTFFTNRRIIESTFAFVLDGPVLQDFKWQGVLDISFPNRHANAHGKYEAGFYTEENSIKLFLMLDTLFQIISSANIQSKSKDKTNSGEEAGTSAN